MLIFQRNFRINYLDSAETRGLSPNLFKSRKFGDAEVGAAVRDENEVFQITAVSEADRTTGRAPQRCRCQTETFVRGCYKVRYVFPRAGISLRVEAKGYKPGVSRPLKRDEGRAELDFGLVGNAPAAAGDGMSLAASSRPDQP